MTICINNYIIKIMDKLDDFLRYSTLFLYYGELFSKKQKQYLKIFEKEKELKKKLENLKENFTKENLEKIIEDFDYNEVF